MPYAGDYDRCTYEDIYGESPRTAQERREEARFYREHEHYCPNCEQRLHSDRCYRCRPEAQQD